MRPPERQVRRIRLIPLDCGPAFDERELSSLLEKNHVRVVRGPAWEALRPAVEQTILLLNCLPRPAPWGSYLVSDAASHEVVGICGFKTAPAQGEVEIAYFTFPSYEGCGYATTVAVAMTELAFTSPMVRKVIAHTLMEQNASTRVLTKCGFVRAGEAQDPDEGTVWRWELGRPSDDSRGCAADGGSA